MRISDLSSDVCSSDLDSLSLRVSYLHDVGNEHDSYIITPSIGYGTPLGTKTYAGVGVSADYVGKGHSQTYFGVTPAGDVASGLPAYAVSDSGFKNVRLSTYALQSLTGDLLHGPRLAHGVSDCRHPGTKEERRVG